MPPTISKIVQAMKPSATMAMAAKAKELKSTGKSVFDLSLGEPDFDTPAHICDAATQAMKDGFTHYTPAGGLPELKQAIVDDYRQRYGLDYNASQVVVSNGAKHSLHNVFAVLLDPGDEVILPAPFWVSYSELIKLTGATPVIVQTDEANDFKMTVDQLKGAITDRTKMVLLCSPSNPTGSMYSPDELGALADVVIERDLLVVADEIYDRLVYGSHTFASFPTVRSDLAERTIVVNGVSKTFAMTGWRIGWALGPAEVIQAIGSLQSQQTGCPSSVGQRAALAAITGPQECVDQMLQEFAKRREYVRGRVASIDGLECAEMAGAFYAFINIKQHLGRSYGAANVTTDEQWCLALLEQKNVAMVMGSAFGAPGYARASFATSMENLEAAFDRIEAFVAG